MFNLNASNQVTHQITVSNLCNPNIRVQKLNEIYLSLKKSVYDTAIISSSRDSYNYIKDFYQDDISIFESFYILLLNRRNETVGYAKISQGGVAGTVVDCKIVAKYAIESLSSSVILAHNHPSGNIKPSQADIKITTKIKEALSLFDIKVLDHIILTDQSYYSFADEGLI